MLIASHLFASSVTQAAPSDFQDFLIARDVLASYAGVEMGKPDQVIGGGGGSPKVDRRRRRARPWGTVVSPAQARDGLRLLRGEDLESVSRELGITAARAAQWRDQFLAAGQASLIRAPDAWDEANRRLQAKIGERLMENELLYAKQDQLEVGGPLARRRSRR